MTRFTAQRLPAYAAIAASGLIAGLAIGRVEPVALAAPFVLALLAVAVPAPVELGPEVARPGDAVLVRVRAAGEPAGSLAGRPLSFWRRGDSAWAVGALPIETPPGPASVKIALPGEPELATTLTVVEPGFRSKSIHVPEKSGFP